MYSRIVEWPDYIPPEIIEEFLNPGPLGGIIQYDVDTDLALDLLTHQDLSTFWKGVDRWCKKNDCLLLNAYLEILEIAWHQKIGKAQSKQIHAAQRQKDLQAVKEHFNSVRAIKEKYKDHYIEDTLEKLAITLHQDMSILESHCNGPDAAPLFKAIKSRIDKRFRDADALRSEQYELEKAVSEKPELKAINGMNYERNRFILRLSRCMRIYFNASLHELVAELTNHFFPRGGGLKVTHDIVRSVIKGCKLSD